MAAEPSQPDELWGHTRVPRTYSGLLYNRAADSLIAITRVKLNKGPDAFRLWYRGAQEDMYRPVAIHNALESQDDAHSCEASPFLIFNEFRLSPLPQKPLPPYLQQLLKGEPSPTTWGADWIGIRRFDLITGSDRRVLEEGAIRPPAPYKSAWVSDILSVWPDGAGAVCKVALTAGGRVRYIVYDVSFTEGLKRKIAELPRVFL